MTPTEPLPVRDLIVPGVFHELHSRAAERRGLTSESWSSSTRNATSSPVIGATFFSISSTAFARSGASRPVEGRRSGPESSPSPIVWHPAQRGGRSRRRGPPGASRPRPPPGPCPPRPDRLNRPPGSPAPEEALRRPPPRPVNESDTSLIVTDLLGEVFGYDKYSEVTRELCIRGTFCDLATRIEGKFQTIIEVKAIGLDLKDAHTKQAVDYAANQGIEWVVLTNGAIWRVFRVIFGKPIDSELVLDIDLLQLNHKSSSHLESLYLLTRESMLKSGLYAYHDHLQATNKFYLAAIVLSEPVLETVRRELRRVSDVLVDISELRQGLASDVLKREVTEGDKAEAAKKKVQRSADKVLRTRRKKADSAPSPQTPPAAPDRALPDA